ncbi:MAG: D-alanine--D-alanine ligase [Tannerella sp.]|nr:D-alanine--D-alanine ligase [Tannerella sp.]
MKKNIAIIAGGYSSEFEVSLRSAENLYSFLDKERYNVHKVILTKDNWYVVTDRQGIENIPIDKNNFSFTQDNKVVKIDFAYITIHGSPGEDGLLQGYFDMLDIPYSTCGVLTSALTFDKYTCNQFLKGQGITISDSMLFRRGQTFSSDEIVKTLGLPVFVKPNAGGSSFGITKVVLESQMQEAVDKAFDESDEVVIERFISGTELTCGCYQSGDRIIALPVTEVIPENEFFDYGAKYNGEVQEITPARISDELTEKIRCQTAKIYELIRAQGIIRIDYIATADETPVLLEVNTTPGMTATSFIPQQVRAAGMKMEDILTDIIENIINKY